ncbi:putative oxidoreductase [Annulohypoxylon truncatum]|uniref:putative oxidoreductase n=1 Tax=Annulohypoxylon truncatum TaxID=327061 RepID=UPI002007F514|nr:putative oxidoreductase [Annulohypoxylon truncatum]KAI1206947.1 putative oxidoreductase [Annulohypoxylon truncatum]
MDVPGFALVTGAASGIGRACANTFARDGAAGVALFDLNLESLLEVKAEIEEKGYASNGKACRIVVHQVDVSNEDQVNQSVKAVVEAFGRLDYVANAAGVAMKHEGGAAFAHLSDWQRILDINLTGSLIILKAASQIMLKQEPILSSIDQRPVQRGSIVLFGSIQSVAGIPLSTAYAASKAGVLGLTRSASEDYAKDGLRINAVCPGYTETPLTTKNPGVFKAMQERVTTAVPMMRVGKPQEIADGVVYLAGGRSSFVTGTALMVDGGYTER